jgi:hypothetical protein
MGWTGENSTMPYHADENRAPSVAGSFYPSEPEVLAREVTRLLGQVKSNGRQPKAIIAPHAGYVYSGPVAASAYAQVAPGRDTLTRVILLGPAHRKVVPGLAASSARSFSTPLGSIPVDSDGVRRALQFSQVELYDDAYDGEHCLEVQLPFLQLVLDDFSIVPLLVGGASGDQVAEVIGALWGGPETLIVISSDLSHYLSYDDARRMDAATSNAIEKLAPEGIPDDGACGRQPIKGLLQVAKRMGLTCQTLDVRNSGDTAGPRGEVVGYGAYTFTAQRHDA